MGQRHQFYVIANIGGRYRLLAAAHHQWLYGDAAISQCLRVLRIMSAAGNLYGIQRELHRALAVDWTNEIWVDKSKVCSSRRHNSSHANVSPTQKQATDSLFPFIATCLAIGSSVGSQSLQTLLLNLNTHFDDIPNDDGISIFDISEPQRPRYAFMFPGENDLMDALQYMHCYMSRGRSSWPSTYERKEMSPPDVKSCLDFRPLAVEAMYDTWSQRKMRFTSRMLDVSASEANDRKVTLKDQSLARLLDTALRSTDLKWLSEAELLPEFRPALKAKLYDDPDDVVSSPLGLELLARALDGEAIIDLGPFPLSFSQIRQVLQQAWGGNSPTFRSLSLPEIRSITMIDLKSIVEDFAPARLVLGTTPRITLREQLKTVYDTSVMDFLSDALYKRPLEMTSRYSHKLSTLPPSEFPSHKSQICQLIFLKHFPTQEAPVSPRSADGAIQWSELSPTTNEWSSREEGKPAVVTLPFRDAPISPDRIPSLLPLLQALSDMEEGKCGSFSMGPFVMDLAKAHASAGDMIRPLPAELMVEYSRYSCSSSEHPLKTLKLGPTQWNLLVTCSVIDDTNDTEISRASQNVNDAVAQAMGSKSLDINAFNDMLGALSEVSSPKQQLRYSFVRRGEDGDITNADVSEFLHDSLAGFDERAHDVEDEWQKAASQLKAKKLRHLDFNACDVKEVRQAMTYLDARDARIDAYIDSHKEELEKRRKFMQAAAESW